jgi:hypothetical protein
MTEKERRRKLLTLTLILLLGLPLYLIVASLIVGVLTAPTIGPDGQVERSLHWTVECGVYAVLGLIWALPLKGLSKGLAKPARTALD